MQPSLETKRLLLRPFTDDDIDRVHTLAGDKRIADVTVNIPHPYPDNLAKEWISTHSKKWETKELVAFAIVLKDSLSLIGCISLMNIVGAKAELGYWIGTNFWNNGYCSEACKRLVRFAFEHLELTYIHAHHLSRNPASGKVLLNAGLIHIGSDKAKCGYRGLTESIEKYEIINS